MAFDLGPISLTSVFKRTPKAAVDEPCINPADADLIRRIENAAADAGFCRTCGKPDYHEDPEQECECVGGSKALHRYERFVERVLQKRIEEEAKKAQSEKSPPADQGSESPGAQPSIVG